MSSSAATVAAHRFTFDDVLAMVDAGILDEDARVELEGGVLVDMSPTGPKHSGVLERLIDHFTAVSPRSYRVRVQDTFLTPDGGFVVPDLMLIEPIGDDTLPQTALLVVEVAYSSRARDIEKAATYAAAGVREYWIVDVERGDLLRHRTAQAGGYADVERAEPGDTVAPGVDAPALDVGALLAG